MKHNPTQPRALFAFACFGTLALGWSACSSSECVTAADCALTEACTLEGICVDVDAPPSPAPQRAIPPAELNLGFVQEGRILVPHAGTQIILVQSEGRLAVVDAASGALETTVALEGTPVQGRILNDGRVLVSYLDRRAVDVVPLADAEVTTVPLPAAVTASAQTPDGRVFVALPALGVIAQLDLDQGEIVHSWPQHQIPAGMEGTPDGNILVAFLNDGITLDLDPDNAEPPEWTEWVQPGVDVRRVGRPIFAGDTVELPFEELIDLPTAGTSTFCPTAYYTAPPISPPCPTEPFEGVAFNVENMVPTLRTVVARRARSAEASGTNDTRVRPAQHESPLLIAQVATAYDRTLHLSLDEGTGSVLLYTTDHRDDVSSTAFGRLQADIGSRDMALSRDGRRVFVYNDIERSLFAFLLPAPPLHEPDGVPAPLVDTVTYRKVISDAPVPLSIRQGAKLFVESSERTSGTKQFSCASCHPGGGEDGMQWGTHTTMPLLSRRDTLPFHWNNEVTQPYDLNTITIQTRMGGSGLDNNEMVQLFAFIDTLRAPVGLDPEREDVARGAVLFHSDELGCVTCHRGPAFTDGEVRQVLNFGEPTATPALLGAAYTAPYMSDGSAQTLRDVVDLYVRSNVMGTGSDLDENEVSDLVAYLRSL